MNYKEITKELVFDSDGIYEEVISLDEIENIIKGKVKNYVIYENQNRIVTNGCYIELIGEWVSNSYYIHTDYITDINNLQRYITFNGIHEISPVHPDNICFGTKQYKFNEIQIFNEFKKWKLTN